MIAAPVNPLRNQLEVCLKMRFRSAIARGVFLLLLVGSVGTLEAGVSAFVSGNTIHVTVSGTDYTSDQCCIGADIDEDPGYAPPSSSRLGPTVDGMRLTPPPKTRTDAYCSIPCGKSSDSFSFGCNSLGLHTVYGYYADDTTGGYVSAGTATVNVTVPPPFFCPQFVLVGGGSMALTHKYADARPEIEYPGKQTVDGEMPMKIRTVAAPAGTVVYLRVYDPPDESQYGAPHAADDNFDGFNGGKINGSKFSSVTLPANGSVPFTLQTTQFASGDNYEVAASANPDLHTPSFVCDGSIHCQKQKVTAYKRFYVEHREMYRNSELIRSNILLGQRLVYINERNFVRRGDRVRLVHAPSYLRTTLGDTDGFYYEDFTVADTRRNPVATIAANFEIELDAGVTHHFRQDIAIAGTQYGDVLVNLSRPAPHQTDPQFHMNLGYIRNAFWFAFVDLMTFSTDYVGMPYFHEMTDQQMIFGGAKWMAAKTSSTVPANTGLAVAAGTRDPLGGNAFSFGTTTGVYSYVWRDNIDAATSGSAHRFPLTSGNNADITSGEVLVHELAHQWKVNSGYPQNECTRQSYDNPSLFCQMNSPGVSAEYDDGHIAFHYNGATDSEYMTIRRVTEPRPQF